jgi:DNA processing protein
MPTELFYQIALSRIPQIGVVNARRLMSYFETASAIFSANRSDLVKIPHIGPVLAESVFQKHILHEAEQILKACEQSNVRVLFYLDPDYPDRLKQIYDAPIMLYQQGQVDLNALSMLAVVGTRKATDYGRRVTHRLVEDSLGAHVTFVSGLAYGIDVEVHKKCIDLQVPNIAVLAGGFNHIYPAKHKKYLDQLLLNGGILSEYPLHEKPDPRFFPLRNRIIAGMTDATLVVEAAEKGGALITADYANNYHREVFAVPGNLDKLFSEGCNRLIQKNKAIIYTDFMQLCEQMNWGNTPNKIKPSKQLGWSRLTEPETELMALLAKNGEMPLDELAWKLQKKVTEIAITLINLEFQGMVKALPGYVYRIKD